LSVPAQPLPLRQRSPFPIRQNSPYDGLPLPGLAEAIRLRDAFRARREVARLVAAFDRLRDGLHESSVALSLVP
jgi:hypothetical protein